MSKLDDYAKQLHSAESSEQMGDIIGRALKDPAIQSTQYNALCKVAQDKGFKFQDIILLPN